MIFDVYFTITTKDGKKVPGTKPKSMEWDRIVKDILRSDYVRGLVDRYRSGEKDAKPQLPAINFVGRSNSTRRADAMIPTQLFMIDIDHCEDPRGSWDKLSNKMVEIFGKEWVLKNLILAHITPSGKGLHLFYVQQGFPTLKENMDFMNEKLHFDDYGDYDSVVHDYSRVSFAFPVDDLLYDSTLLYLNIEPDWGEVLVNKDLKMEGLKIEEGSLFSSEEKVVAFTNEEVCQFEALDYRGTPVKEIVAKYIEIVGEPTSGEVHNFYNGLVKNFRCITSNNRRALLYLLPTFGHSYEECWSQIVSICRYNTLSRIPRDFYFFLKDNGFYIERVKIEKETIELDKGPEERVRPPFLPPVFRELVNTAPDDFVLPCINSLLPILGTLSSYLKSTYPYDGREHTTSFFSVIYAPPGTGKGFVERFMDLLFEDIKLRDFVQSERENVYLRAMVRKSDKDQAPEQPHTSLRIIPAKNSEAEFLQKQRDNHGYHMFTYAAEMDSWAKGVRAAGGNKDDMIRIAWDNGEYGQQFKSVNTFKGSVKLYWNVLITGTFAQLESYFKNVENGLVTRCSFMSIDNQEFASAPRWKVLNKRSLDVIHKYMSRCDRNTYTEPCNIVADDLLCVKDDTFDKEVNWRFVFRERREVDCSWVMPIIDKFHEEQREKAAKEVDQARDVFRRRVGVRGFRLAILCHSLWENPRSADLENCKKFIWWWMHKDLESMLMLWGEKYRAIIQPEKKFPQCYLFNELNDEFTAQDVQVKCIKLGIKTAPRRVIFDWRKVGIIKEVSSKVYKKVK